MGMIRRLHESGHFRDVRPLVAEPASLPQLAHDLLTHLPNVEPSPCASFTQQSCATGSHNTWADLMRSGHNVEGNSGVRTDRHLTDCRRR
jgi:hypothetical protein